MRRTHFTASPALVLAAGVLLCAFQQPAAAQQARSGGSGGGPQSAQLVQQLQQLASERTAMQAEQARMKKEIEELRKERDALKAGQADANQRVRAASDAALTRSARERENVEAELTKTKARMEDLVGKFRETAQTLREVETDRTVAKQAFERQATELNACVATNMELYTLNDEVLTRFSEQGFWSRVGQAEPFTRLKRVELENLIDGYKTRALDQKLAPGVGAQASPLPTTR
jgi:DNA repair exonuclease SbcCD ATPase subunit